MARRTVVATSQRLAQISCYHDSLGLENEERLKDVPAFLIGKTLSYWCSIDDYAPELRSEDWEGFKHLMLARFSGKTVGSTIAKMQRLRYNGDCELLAERLRKFWRKGITPTADLTRDLFLSRFPIEMVKPILEEDFSNWVQARERMRDIRANKQESAFRWYGLTLPECRREAALSQQNDRKGWLPGELCLHEGKREQMDTSGHW